MTSNGTRVAVIAGCRTPFAKASTAYRDLSAVDLARIAVRELLERSEAEPAWVDTVIMGQVIPSVRAPNLAREVVLGTAMPPGIPAHTVNRACASANEAIAEVASAILQGHAEVGIGGGAESLSDIPILHSKRMTRILMEAPRARKATSRWPSSSPGRWRPWTRAGSSSWARPWPCPRPSSAREWP